MKETPATHEAFEELIQSCREAHIVFCSRSYQINGLGKSSIPRSYNYACTEPKREHKTK